MYEEYTTFGKKVTYFIVFNSFAIYTIKLECVWFLWKLKEQIFDTKSKWYKVIFIKLKSYLIKQ